MADNSFQFMLAKTYLEGNDEEKALEGLETMKTLAEGGSADAAYEVALVYSEGCLVLNDQEEAKKWYRKAIELGHEGARAKLAALEGGTDPKTVRAPSAPPSSPEPPASNDGPAFKCGKCGQIVRMKITSRIDVTGKPELKAQVLNAQFFNQTCPNCGTAGVVPYPCIYVDNDKSLFVDVCSDRKTAIDDEDTNAPLDMGGWDEQWRMEGEHDVRVAVGGLNELREMILIVDAGLEPYGVMLCKRIVRSKQNIKSRGHLYFMGIDRESGDLQFWYVNAEPERLGTCTLPRQAYDEIETQIHDLDFEPLRLCELVDEDSVVGLLDRTASTDPSPSTEFWEKKEAAKTHEPEALFNLGVAYYNGDGVRRNHFKAFKCFRDAAEGGDSDAQHALALCFQNGEGVTQSELRAHAWMSKSAEQGNPLGMYGMGVYCQRGIFGEEQDIDKAIDWYRKSAEAGYGRAYLELAKIYEADDGGKKNLKEAYACYKAALEGGYDEAKEGVERLASYAADEPPAPPEPPVPPVASDKGVAPLTPRDLIKECAEAFQTIAMDRGFASDEIEARTEFDFAENIIHFYENEPSLAVDYGEENIDGARATVLHWSWRAGIVYGAKFRTEPKSIDNETMRQVLAEKKSFQFSADILSSFFRLDETGCKSFNDKLYAAWQKIFAPCVGCSNETQLVSCLYYVGFHLGVTMMMNRRKVPEGSTFTYGKDGALLAGAVPPAEEPHDNPVPPSDAPVPPPDAPVPPSDKPNDTPPPEKPVTPPSDGGDDGHNVECPKCHQRFTPVIQDRFDLDANPADFKRLLDLSAFAQTCPHCHGVSCIPYPTLVSNVGKGYVMRLVFDYEEARAMDRAKLSFVEDDMVGKVRQRVVCGVMSFKEKLLIFNHGLDDNIIEAIKLVFLKEHDVKNIANMLFAGIKNGKFDFAIFIKGASEPKIWSVPSEAYEKLAEELKEAFPETHVRYVSHVTVG